MTDDFDALRAERDAVLAQLDDATNQHWVGKRARWAALVRAQDAEIQRLKATETVATNAATLTRWVVHDDHTFTKLPADNAKAHAAAMQCFDDDDGYVGLCGTWNDEQRGNRARPRPPMLHAGNRETRDAFSDEAMRWLEENT